ncbi:NnrU family protein [Novosphingobium sp. CCH12-A3]|uniref:NnrU family protein n=1 Tax=Novosphingobium sp. CCH12-A3 TaxID=1768752 RepID=UPI000780A3D6|nr:NnrU family protein [Novosphingobium sp. CCH12-A3]
MDHALIQLIVATTAFVFSHFVMSGPAREPLVSIMGKQGFLLFYSVISFATLAWASVTFVHAASAPLLWDGTGDVPWVLSSLLTIAALTLLIPSFAGNPALPGKKLAGLSAVLPAGVFRVTRHPMMWSIALWAFAHILVAPSPRVLVLMTGLIILSLVGSHFQDKRKLAENRRDVGAWQRRTSFLPRIAELPALGTIWLYAAILWFLVTWLHFHLTGIPAGLWKWLA